MAEVPEDFLTLIDRARQGDAAALALLTRQYEAEVRIVARVLLGPALRPYLDSADVVQSVHRIILLGLRQAKFELSSPDKLINLALSLVRRKVARHWRHLRRQQRLECGIRGTLDLAEILTSLTSPGPGPAEAAQLREQVQRLLDHLDGKDRRLAELRLDGHTTAEIACQLDLEPGAVRVRLTRLRQSLRAAGLFPEYL